MTDLKTVASALHHCIVTDSSDNKCVDGCIYADSCDACKYDSSNEFVISEQLVRDALSLIMKQNNKIILEGIFEERKDGVLAPSRKAELREGRAPSRPADAERQRQQSIRDATAALFKTEVPENQGEEYDGSETGW